MTSLPERIAFVDVETTGTNPLFDRIIDIGIIRIENGKVVDTLDTLVNPQKLLPPQIEYITGIHSRELENAPVFEEVKEKVNELLDNCLFAAHNARFDYAFFKNEFGRLEYKFNKKTLCTLKLSRFLNPQYKKHNLDEIIKRYGISCSSRHRAYPDAKVLWDFYVHSLKNTEPETFKRAISRVMKTYSLPVGIKKSTVENLPEGSGVYVFFGKNENLGEETPLYIGKSINIKDRVKSHFSTDYNSQTDIKLSQTASRIEFVHTAGNMGALIREALMIKRLQPLYNKQLRRSGSMYAAKIGVNKNGYLTIEYIRLKSVSLNELDKVVCVNRSLRKLKEDLHELAAQNNLCLKLLDLEKSNKECFNYQIDKCSGACLGKETALKYNLRFLQAFSGKKIKVWPFDNNAIAIKEYNLELVETHFIYKWCYLGSVVSSKDNEQVEKNIHKNAVKILNSYAKESLFSSEQNGQTVENFFDWDIYKIIRKIIFNPKLNKTMNVLSLSKVEKMFDHDA